MRVLVTGSTGFLGRVVVRRLLADGHVVTALARESSAESAPVEPGANREFVADALDYAGLVRVVTAGDFEVIVHCAALTNIRESMGSPARFFDVNTSGTAVLLAAISSAREKRSSNSNSHSDNRPMVINISTASVYGNDNERPTEATIPNPSNPYARSKMAAELLLSFYANAGTIDAISLRCSNLAGGFGAIGSGNFRQLIPIALRAAWTGNAMFVNGDGRAERDYVHVVDVADAIRLAASCERAELDGHRVYNVSAGHGHSVLDVIADAERTTGRAIAVEHRDRVDEARRLVPNSELIAAELGWRPRRVELATIIDDAWHAMRAAE